MGLHVAAAPRNHVTDAIMRHAASRDTLKAERPGSRRKVNRAAFHPRPAKQKFMGKTAPMALAATPILASQPAVIRPSLLRSSADYFFVRPASFVKNVLQGGLSGLVTFFSAIQFSGGGSRIVPTGDFASEIPPFVTAALSGLPAGAMAGVAGIIGAAILFMNAGRGIARTIGLTGFIVLAAAYANGANGENLVPYLEGVYQQIKGLLPLLAGFI